MRPEPALALPRSATGQWAARLLPLLWLLGFSCSAVPAGEPGSVSATLHNLSVSGPGEIKSLEETEVCKFCHIPHNAETPVELWSRELPRSDYRVPSVRDSRGGRAPVPQPDGSSRLCLSCHDGTVALGKIAGESRTVLMSGADRLAPGRRGFIGADLTGSHPVSFEVSDSDPGAGVGDGDIGLRSLAAIRAASDIPLDDQGKMQCTTCHDPHSDAYHEPGRVPRFWIRPTVEEVCLSCHELL